jgi:hypothetical protein
MIKVIDSLGEVHTIPEALWNSLSKMKNCKFRLAEVPIPKEVIEFKPTPAKQPTEVDKLIDEKQCCKESCKDQVEVKHEKPKEKRTTKKKGKK